MTYEDLTAKYEQLQSTLTHVGALVDAGRLISAFLADVEALRRAEADETLSIAEAADVSGYSKDHVSRLIRSGEVPNAGKPNRPRVRRGDLPQKGRRSIAARSGAAYNPSTDALSLMGRLKEAR